MYLDNLLNKNETKINETLKAKYDLSEIVKENKEMAKRPMMVFNERERSKKIQRKNWWIYQSYYKKKVLMVIIMNIKLMEIPFLKDFR